jgi:hypothetical protein
VEDVASTDEVTSITVDDGTVFWTEGSPVDYTGALKSVVFGEAPVELANELDLPDSVVVDGNDVYWVTRGVHPEPGSIMKVDRAGGTPVTVASGFAGPDSIAIDDTSVYCTVWGDDPIAGQGTVVKLPK